MNFPAAIFRDKGKHKFGEYTVLSKIFHDTGAVWLEVGYCGMQRRFSLACVLGRGASAVEHMTTVKKDS